MDTPVNDPVTVPPALYAMLSSAYKGDQQECTDVVVDRVVVAARTDDAADIVAEFILA